MSDFRVTLSSSYNAVLLHFFRATWMQFFAYSLTREELSQDLLTAQYGRLNQVLHIEYSINERTYHKIYLEFHKFVFKS